jgi:hypothetical protein
MALIAFAGLLLTPWRALLEAIQKRGSMDNVE